MCQAATVWLQALQGPAQFEDGQVDFPVDGIGGTVVGEGECRLGRRAQDDIRRAARAGAVGAGGKVNACFQMRCTVVGRGNLHIVWRCKQGRYFVGNEIIAGLKRDALSIHGDNISRGIGDIREQHD